MSKNALSLSLKARSHTFGLILMRVVGNQFELLSKRRFLPLFCTQFLGAFNDNLYKNALIILLAFSTQITLANQYTLINVCAALFIIPYFLFSAFAGQIADKFEKSELIRWIKIAEVTLAVLVALGFVFHNLILLLAALFLLGTQATFFGPLKYSILPQHLDESELMGGNGLVEMGTFIAILLGTIAGGILIAIPDTGVLWVSITIAIIALIGWGTSILIPKAPPYAHHLKLDWNPVRQTVQILKETTKNKLIFHIIIGISWFWLYGSNFLTQAANYTKSLGGNEHVATLLLTTFSIGIGLGSVLCEKMSGRKIEMGLVLFGSLGLTLFAADLSLIHNPIPDSPLGAWEFIGYGQYWRILLDSILMGMFGGFYLVPLYALIQQKSKPEERSRVIAANNIINAIFMTIASLMAIVLLNSGFTIPQFFLVTALLNLVVAVYLCVAVPEFLMRFIIWSMLNTAYKVVKQDLKFIPRKGGALLVCNGQHKMDILILLGVCQRNIHPVVDPNYSKSIILKFLLKTAKALPIGAHENSIKKLINEGELVAVFPDLYHLNLHSLTNMTNTLNVPIVSVDLESIKTGFLSRTKVKVVTHKE